jgi:hypothetical protein
MILTPSAPVSRHPALVPPGMAGSAALFFQTDAGAFFKYFGPDLVVYPASS